MMRLSKTVFAMSAIMSTALFLCSTHTVSAFVLEACDGAEESGMNVGIARKFGDYESGFAYAPYSVKYEVQKDKYGSEVHIPMAAPIPELDDFDGYRIIDCRTGNFIAIKAPNNSVQIIANTEFLRNKIQQEKPIRYQDIVRAAKAVFMADKDPYTNVIELKETEQTCECAAYYPDLWSAK